MMNISSRLIVLSVTLFVFVNPVFAKESKDRRAPPNRPDFASVDADGNGEINFDEFSLQELPSSDHETIFSHIDEDGDGIITEQEFSSHKPPRRKKDQSR